MVVFRSALALALLLLVGGCGTAAGTDSGAATLSDEDDDGMAPEPQDSGPKSFPVEIGTPDVITASTFTELAEEGDVTIQDGGQGGTHALVALRFSGLGQWIFYEVSITDLEGGGAIETPPLVRPRPTLCDEEVFECRMSPILVVIGGLADRDVWDGLHVEITARVSNEAGDEGIATKRAYLRR